MLAAARHSSTIGRLAATRPYLLGGERSYPVQGRSDPRATECEIALRSLVCAALGDQPHEAIAAGCRMDRSDVSKLLRGVDPMTTAKAKRLARAADDERALVAEIDRTVLAADPVLRRAA